MKIKGDLKIVISAYKPGLEVFLGVIRTLFFKIGKKRNLMLFLSDFVFLKYNGLKKSAGERST